MVSYSIAIVNINIQNDLICNMPSSPPECNCTVRSLRLDQVRDFSKCPLPPWQSCSCRLDCTVREAQRKQVQLDPKCFWSLPIRISAVCENLRLKIKMDVFDRRLTCVCIRGISRNLPRYRPASKPFSRRVRLAWLLSRGRGKLAH